MKTGLKPCFRRGSFHDALGQICSTACCLLFSAPTRREKIAPCREICAVFNTASARFLRTDGQFHYMKIDLPYLSCFRYAQFSRKLLRVSCAQIVDFTIWKSTARICSCFFRFCLIFRMHKKTCFNSTRFSFSNINFSKPSF